MYTGIFLACLASFILGVLIAKKCPSHTSQRFFVTLNFSDKQGNNFFTLKAKSIMATLTNEQFVTGEWGAPINRKGKPAKVENIRIVSSDPSVLAVESPNPDTPDNPLSFKATPPDQAIGSATVQIFADANLDPNVTEEISDFISFDVKNEQAVGFASPTIGEPQDKA